MNFIYFYYLNQQVFTLKLTDTLLTLLMCKVGPQELISFISNNLFELISEIPELSQSDFNNFAIQYHLYLNVISDTEPCFRLLFLEITNWDKDILLSFYQGVLGKLYFIKSINENPHFHIAFAGIQNLSLDSILVVKQESCLKCSIIGSPLSNYIFFEKDDLWVFKASVEVNMTPKWLDSQLLILSQDSKRTTLFIILQNNDLPLFLNQYLNLPQFKLTFIDSYNRNKSNLKDILEFFISKGYKYFQ